MKMNNTLCGHDPVYIRSSTTDNKKCDIIWHFGLVESKSEIRLFFFFNIITLFIM